MNEEQILNRICDFIRNLGIPVRFRSIESDCFLPGILIEAGGLSIDPEKMKYPGDLLHEAAHIAVVPPADRPGLGADAAKNRPNSSAEEMMCIAWSYAAALHIGIDPYIVFHEFGYKGGGASIVENFSEGRYFGVPMLEWTGLCANKEQISQGAEPYPKMLKWML